jgi:hypothetical protein
VLVGTGPGGTGPGGAGVAALRASFDDVADHLGGLLLAAGHPNALRAAGAAWVRDVGRPVSALIGALTDDVLDTGDRWTGPAADAYRAAFAPQQLALSTVVAICQDVDSGFEELASAITSFWIAIGSACLGLVVALAGALGSAATVVGVPASTAIAAAGLSALFAAVKAALDSLTEITSGAATHGVALRRRLGDSTAFPLEAWPRSTRAIGADASVTDGDGSDWQPR